jgi:hypothetical protein
MRCTVARRSRRRALSTSGFFDAADLTAARDAAVEGALRRRAPELPWEAMNQAVVDLCDAARVAVAPVVSCAEAIATFPETATSVAVRLLEDDDILVVAPHDLDDLLDGVCRHTRPASRRASTRSGRWPRAGAHAGRAFATSPRAERAARGVRRPECNNTATRL